MHTHLGQDSSSACECALGVSVECVEAIGVCSLVALPLFVILERFCGGEETSR